MGRRDVDLRAFMESLVNLAAEKSQTPKASRVDGLGFKV